jgi:hypothetical protein
MFFIFLELPAQVTSFNGGRTSGTSTKSNENEDWVKSGELPAQTSESGRLSFRGRVANGELSLTNGNGNWDPASEGDTRLVKGRTPTTC